MNTSPDKAALVAIERLELQRRDALIACDLFTLEAITHEDYIHIDARGALRTKRDYLASIATAAVRIVESSQTENQIQVHDGTALVTGIFDNFVQTASGMERRIGRHSRVYIFISGTWLNILHQGTEFPHLA